MKSEEEDLLVKALAQMEEDRRLIRESYEKFSGQVVTGNDYFQNGANLNKCLELMVKQTAQIVELLKLDSAGKKKEKGLSAKEIEELYKGMNDGFM